VLKRLRFRFWTWAHRRAEDLWHWIYYRKLLPVTPKQKIVPSPMFFCGHQEPSDEEKKRGITVVGVYRSMH
jgi:hypothetical protein